MLEVSGVAIDQASDLEEFEFVKNFIRIRPIPKDLVKYGMEENTVVGGYNPLAYAIAR